MSNNVLTGVFRNNTTSLEKKTSTEKIDETYAIREKDRNYNDAVRNIIAKKRLQKNGKHVRGFSAHVHRQPEEKTDKAMREGNRELRCYLK